MANKSTPKTEPCDMSKKKMFQVELWLSSITLCFQLLIAKNYFLPHKILIQIIDLDATIYQRLWMCPGILS